MIIEFAGPSCAGKSTLVRALLRELREQGFRARHVSAHSALRSDKLRAMRDARLLAWCMLNLRMVRTWKARRLLAAVALTRRVRLDGDLVLLDEGPVKLHQLGPLPRARGKRILLSAMPAPDVLVIVTCSPEVRLARLRREKRPYARSLGDEEILSRLTNDHHARQFAAVRNVPVVEVDTSGPEDPLPRLREQLHQFLDPSSAGTCRVALS